MYICTSQSIFSHSYVVNECRNRHCDAQIDIRIRADELGNNSMTLENNLGLEFKVISLILGWEYRV
jgi:hypothetical protein